MTPQERPEWFEISEGDDSANVRRVSKRLPVSALLVTLAILGVGAVVAQTQEESPASAIETSVPVATQNLTTTNSTSPATTEAPSAPVIANPPAKRGGDDDDKGEHHGSRPSHGDEGDDDHEGFEDDD